MARFSDKFYDGFGSPNSHHVGGTPVQQVPTIHFSSTPGPGAQIAPVPGLQQQLNPAAAYHPYANPSLGLAGGPHQMDGMPPVGAQGWATHPGGAAATPQQMSQSTLYSAHAGSPYGQPAAGYGVPYGQPDPGNVAMTAPTVGYAGMAPAQPGPGSPGPMIGMVGSPQQPPGSASATPRSIKEDWQSERPRDDSASSRARDRDQDSSGAGRVRVGGYLAELYGSQKQKSARVPKGSKHFGGLMTPRRTNDRTMGPAGSLREKRTCVTVFGFVPDAPEDVLAEFNRIDLMYSTPEEANRARALHKRKFGNIMVAVEWCTDRDFIATETGKESGGVGTILVMTGKTVLPSG